MELARIGYDLILNYAANRAAAQQTAVDCQALAQAQPHQVRVEICQADISRSGDRENLVDCVRKTYGRLDLLVNNAGIAPAVRADILEATEASFDRVLEVNLKGPYFLTQLVAKWMIERAVKKETSAGRSKIITISSISAYTASINRGDYCIAKAGLAMLTSLFAARLAEYDIGVYEVRPGIVDTDMTSAVKPKYDRLIQEGLTPIARWGTPADVGKAVAAIAQDAFPFSTGEVINVDGGFHLRRL